MSTCQSHTDKGSCRVRWQFSLFRVRATQFFEASCLPEMIMWRKNTRFASPTFSEHQMFPGTFFFFKQSCRDLASRCLCILGQRGRFTWSCYILIRRFKFSLSPRICCHGGTTAVFALEACMASHASGTRMHQRLKRPDFNELF